MGSGNYLWIVLLPFIILAVVMFFGTLFFVFSNLRKVTKARSSHRRLFYLLLAVSPFIFLVTLNIMGARSTEKRIEFIENLPRVLVSKQYPRSMVLSGEFSKTEMLYLAGRFNIIEFYSTDAGLGKRKSRFSSGKSYIHTILQSDTCLQYAKRKDNNRDRAIKKKAAQAGKQVVLDLDVYTKKSRQKRHKAREKFQSFLNKCVSTRMVSSKKMRLPDTAIYFFTGFETSFMQSNTLTGRRYELRLVTKEQNLLIDYSETPEQKKYLIPFAPVAVKTRDYKKQLSREKFIIHALESRLLR